MDSAEQKDLSPQQKELLPWKGEGFDLRTHITDPATGKVIKYQPYRLVVSREEGTYYVRDGKRYSAQGHVIDAPQSAEVVDTMQPKKLESKPEPKAEKVEVKPEGKAKQDERPKLS